MSYKINQTSEFEKEAKYLSRKYASFKNDLAVLAASLANDPKQGTSLGNNRYKIRLAITSKGKGKSGGARIITYVAVIKETLYFIGVYDKSEQTTMTDKEINARLKGLH